MESFEDLKRQIKILEKKLEMAVTRETGISMKCISNCVRHKSKSAGGYIWEYKTILK